MAENYDTYAIADRIIVIVNNVLFIYYCCLANNYIKLSNIGTCTRS